MKTFLELKNKFLNSEIQPTKLLGDSLDRFDLYRSYAEKCESITEFGVYTGSSTVGFLLGNPKKMRSYDISDKNFSLKDTIENISKENNIDYKFSIGNSNVIEIEETDLLFIDTKHTYKNTIIELNKHHEKVKKYIILHDTTSFPPVFEAVEDFLKNNSIWNIDYRCQINSGVTVLKKLK